MADIRMLGEFFEASDGGGRPARAGDQDIVGVIDELSAASHSIPDLGIYQDDVVFIRGWAIQPSHLRPISRVAVMLAGEIVAEAITRGVRHDVAEAYGSPRATLTGFEAVFPVTDAASGSSELCVAGMTSDAEIVEIFATATLNVRSEKAARDRADVEGQIDTWHDPAHSDAGLRRKISRGRTTLVTGWIVDPIGRRAPLRLLFLIDGKPALLEERLVDRADVSLVYGSEALQKSGFATILPTERLSPGAHALSVCAVFETASGWSQPLELGEIKISMRDTLDVHVVPMYAIACIDAISINGERQDQKSCIRVKRSQVIIVEGWAIDELNDSVPSAIFIELDHGQRFDAVTGLERLDVAQHFSNDKYWASGYRCEIETTALGPGNYRADVRVLMASKTVAYITFAQFAFAVES